jgi:hypothetical protein
MNSRSMVISALLACVCGCATAIVPAGQSLANNQLQFDALRVIRRFELAREMNGEMGVSAFGYPKVVVAKIIQPPSSSLSGRWQEIWTIQRDDTTVDYSITYIPRPDIGGTDLDISPMHMPGPTTQPAPATPTDSNG